MKFPILSSFAFGSLALSACASTPGAQPADMSAAQHEQAAATQEAQATSHAQQSSATNIQATPERSNAQCAFTNAGCWSSISSPTQQHKEDADKHRKMAADHRGASKALRDAETWACSGVSNDDRDISPFDHREDITSVQPAYVHISGKAPRDQLVGAVVTFRAVSGMTAEWLQRVVDCHLARNNALGNEMPEMPYCPLVPKGITATVSSAGNGFSVRIESQDPNSTKEVLRRAQALGSGG